MKCIAALSAVVFGLFVTASCHDNRDPMAPCQDKISPRETRLWCRGSTTATVDGNDYTSKFVLTKCVFDYRDYGGSLSSGDFYWYYGKQAMFELVSALNDCSSPTFKGKYSATLDACEPAPKNPYKPSDGKVWPLALPEDAHDVFAVVAKRLFVPGQLAETVTGGVSDAGVERHPRDEAACDACAAAMCPLSLCDGNANCVCWLGCAAAGNTQDTCAKPPGTVTNVTTCGPRGIVTASFASCLQTACAGACVADTTDPATCANVPMMSTGTGTPACTAFGGACGLMITGEQPPPCCDSTNGTDDACVAGACQ